MVQWKIMDIPTKTTFTKNKKYKHGWRLKVKIHVVLWRQLMTHCPDDGGSTHLWNVSQHQLYYKALHPRRLNFNSWIAALRLPTEVWYSERSYTYLKVLFESFCLTKLLSMVMVRSFEVMFGQTLNHSAQNSVILRNVISPYSLLFHL
jgi:hypothetical protein